MNKKLCPMIFRENEDEVHECLEDKCSWWVEPDEQEKEKGLEGHCAILDIALSMNFQSTK